MKVADYKPNHLNEKLKEREQEELKNKDLNSSENKPLALDDSQRVKVLSPARLVTKRFLKNKLAITGLAILIVMFTMCFLGAALYPYGQTDKFYKIAPLELDYAVCGELSSYTKYFVNEADMNDPVLDDLKLKFDSYIIQMESSNETELSVLQGDIEFIIEKVVDRVYVGYIAAQMEDFGTFDPILGEITAGETVEGLDEVLEAAVKEKKDSVEFDGDIYFIKQVSKTKVSLSRLTAIDGEKKTIIATKLVFDAVNHKEQIDNKFKIAVLQNIADQTKPFTYGDKSYSFDQEDSDNLIIKDESGDPYVYISRYSTRHASGEDSLDLTFKMKAASIVDQLEAENAATYSFEYEVPQINPDTEQYDLDENGNIILTKETVNVVRKETAGERSFYFKYNMNRKLITIYEKPSAAHILGTDGDGYDVFARILFGGRVSLLVGFVVVILETILGVIMGGIAGFFGGWVDTLIMRLVDIFYCIPTMPIMIILASVFDAYKVDPYQRLFWMMVLLGVLGWSGIARLVRGQILSLREQEFMIAAEATGLRTSKRIFKHLVPNVMPQLIVSMTMGLGGVILTESSLSFLGLGVKHPLATWGNMINSVSTIEAMKSYTYIWVPVGILICLTVIAFNFVGDGLRDAFDPKMKR